MKVVDLVKISKEAMKMMSNHGIKTEDWQHIEMYEEYMDMRKNCEKFRYIIAFLAEKYRNLCVVGDDDQSIYRFRGANIRNILDLWCSLVHLSSASGIGVQTSTSFSVCSDRYLVKTMPK